MAVIGNAPFQGLVSGGNIIDASIEGVDLSTSAIAARLGYTPVDPGAAVFSANPTISSGVANGVTYLNGSKVVTSGSALTFDGTALANINGDGTGFSTQSAASNFSIMRLGTDSVNGYAFFQSGKSGTGTTLPFSWRLDSSEAMRLSSTGLGIGLGGSNPSAKLHVKGTEYAQIIETASTTDGDAIRLSLKAPGAQSQVEFEWWNDSTKTGGGYGLIQTGKSANSPSFNFMVGKLGIGTISPANKLEVYQSDAGLGAAKILHVNGNYINVQPSYNYYAAYNHVFQSLNGTDEYGRFDNSGNFGIGTTNPQSKLHVAGAVNQSMSLVAGASADGAIAYTKSEFRECAFNVSSGSNFRISNIVTSATGWRAVFRGTWSNNYEGGGLTPPAPYIEVNSANNSFLVGSRTLAVDRDANGYLVVSCTDTYRISFTGSIEIYDNPQSGQPANSIVTIGKVGVGLRNPNYPLEAAGGVASRGVGFVLRNDAGSSNTGIFSPYNIIAGSGTDYSSTVFSETGLGIYFCVNGSATRSAIINSSGNFGLGTTDINYKITNSGHLAFTTGSIGTDGSGDAQRYGIGWQATGASTVLSSFITANNQGNWGSDIQFFTRGTSGGVLGERMRISAGGGGITAYTNLVFANNYTGIHWATANSGDLYMDCLPGERLVRLRNWNTGSPNIDVTAMQAGTFVPTIGVKFPASQNANSDANTLDDYEEGTWTPTIASNSNVGTISLGTHWYRKVGSLVVVTGSINYGSASSTGAAYIVASLPFPMSASTDPVCGTCSAYPYDNNRQAGIVIDNSSGNPNDIYIGFYISSTNAGNILWSLSYRST